jgi:hypothetical protein
VIADLSLVRYNRKILTTRKEDADVRKKRFRRVLRAYLGLTPTIFSRNFSPAPRAPGFGDSHDPS